ncbi:MAG: hypothetical protein WC433_08095 [Candidatus Omnitrophota bacterium]
MKIRQIIGSATIQTDKLKGKSHDLLDLSFTRRSLSVVLGLVICQGLRLVIGILYRRIKVDLKTESQLDVPDIDTVNAGREPDDLIEKPEEPEEDFDSRCRRHDVMILAAIKADWKRFGLDIEVRDYRDESLLFHGFIAGQRHPEISLF